jgi:excisionase family DNA binding protein
MTDITIGTGGFGGQPLTFAEAAKVVGANERFIRIAVRDGRLPATHGEDGTPRVARAALDEFVAPIFQQFGRALRDLERDSAKRWLVYGRRRRSTVTAPTTSPA